MTGWLRVRRARREAAQWYARMLEPASPAEVAAFEAWLARDPAHARTYAEIDAVSAAAGAVGNRATSARPRPAQARATPAWAMRPALAAGLAALALAVGVLVWPGAQTPAFAALSNPGDAVRGVRLSDGTALWLDLGAEVGVRLTPERREVEVRKGRVRIAPGRDARALEVCTAQVCIRPRASRIDIDVGPAATTVSALEEALSVTVRGAAGDAGPAGIALGHARAFGAGGPRAVQVDRTWPVSRLRFVDASLTRIVALANRQPGPDIVPADSGVAELKVTGVFDLRDTRRLARLLAAALELGIEERPDRLILRR